MKTRKCTKCEIEKPLDSDHFYKSKSKNRVFHQWCKVCQAKANKEYRKNNKEKILKRRRELYQVNKEKIAKQGAEYRSRPEVKERIAKANKEYYKNNKEKILKWQREYSKNNREENLKQNREYRKNNKEKIAKRRREFYQANKEKNRQRAREYYNKNKENRKEYRTKRQKEQPACIYKIVNSVNNKMYIGQTTRGELRWKEHLKDLRDENRKNTNQKLQEDFNKFGEDAFEWSIIKECPKDKDILLLEEARTVVKYRKEGKDLYNLMLTVEQVLALEEEK